ncbi:Hypothetical protein SRAE_1000170800 [Strongyloides ratti]|uniref:Uncharacterized protein n=1 Tax=Strongyloides ratti TaxID=34506 RepID=A0A090L166_STRRB|nr:Hypothetical protein SRAE_1000170800 [Strongyloides ratti]CEF63446.1 Hypothetical protein SRAE_1000170800 [Strongyloides ratti]
MILDFYLSTLLWILLPIFTFCEESIHKTFFPLVPNEINQTTFPITINTDSESDVILFKCPDKEYKHSNVEDLFYLDNSIESSKSTIRNREKIFSWIPLANNNNQFNYINCGNVSIKSNAGGHVDYKWEFKVNWQHKSDPFKMAKRITIVNQLPLTNKCDSNLANVLKFTKDRQNTIIQLKLENDELIKPDELPYVNKLYYYFNKSKDDVNVDQVKPCAIFRAINDRPTMTIQGFNTSLTTLDDLPIKVINLEDVAGSFSTKLFLVGQPNLINFYNDEIMLMKRVAFTRDGIKEIPNFAETIKHSFSLKGFQLLKFSYDWPTHDRNFLSTETFYFGPKTKNHVFPLENTIYPVKGVNIKPNCSINRITFGYLDSISFNGKTVKLEKLSNDGKEKDNFVRSGNYIFTSNINDPKITLKCIYITPNGNVTFPQVFIRIGNVPSRFDGKSRKITDGNDKKFNNIQKEPKIERTEKFEEKSGSIWIYVIIGIILLLIIAIIIIIIIICRRKSTKQMTGKKTIETKKTEKKSRLSLSISSSKNTKE